MSSINNDPNQAWNLIVNAVNNGFLIGADTSSSPPFGMVGGHAYSVVSTHEIKDSTGVVRNRLFRIKNPWGQDVYNGPWNDGDTARWTTFNKA